LCLYNESIQPSGSRPTSHFSRQSPQPQHRREHSAFSLLASIGNTTLED
jgi:hypothetical protein